MPSQRFRYIGSKARVGGEFAYTSTGRVLVPLPMLGQPTGALVSTYFYPFFLPLELDAMPRGGKAVKWWWRVMEWEAHVEWECTIGDFTGSTTLNGDQTFTLFPLNFGHVPPIFNGDERDRRDPRFYRWGGLADSLVSFGSRAGITIDLMPPTPISSAELTDWIGYPASFTGPSYYVIGEAAVAPLFVMRCTLAHHGATVGVDVVNFPVRNYPRNTSDAGTMSPDYPGGSKQMDNGQLDGEEFLVYARADDDVQPSPALDSGSALNSLSITITPKTYWSHGGKYNTGSGDLMEETNEFEDA